MRERGFYIILDQFFTDYPDPYLKGNESENRPHYYALYDAKTSLFWMVPMSSRIKKFQDIIDKRVNAGKPCDTLHICKLDTGEQGAFLMQDMFPIIDSYISHDYTICGSHLRLTSDGEAAIIKQKAQRTLNMIRRGVRFTPTQPDVLAIEASLVAKVNKTRSPQAPTN